MAHQIHLTAAVLVKQIDHEDKVCAVNLVVVDYLTPSGYVSDDQSNTRRWCDGAAIFVAKTAHTRAYRLLADIETARRVRTRLNWRLTKEKGSLVPVLPSILSHHQWLIDCATPPRVFRPL